MNSSSYIFGAVLPIIMCLHVVAKEVNPPPMKSELGKKLVLAIELIAISLLLVTLGLVVSLSLLLLLVHQS